MRRFILGLVAAAAAAASLVPALAAADAHVVYVEETGHHIGGAFLGYWEANGGPDALGNPITEELVIDGVTQQYFERVRLEYRAGSVALGNIAIDLGKAHPPIANPRGETSGDDWRYFPETGQIVAGGFYQFFTANGGAERFGNPISGELLEADRPVQYFERTRLEWNGQGVDIGSVGAELARFRGIQTGRVAQLSGVKAWAPASAAPVAPIEAVAVPPAAPAPIVASGKSIVLSLSEQHLWAYENGELFLSTPITTGQPELATPAGSFSIMSKHTPFTFISPWPQGSPYYYEPSPTTYSMLYAAGGYYIHDAPWRPYYGPGTNVPHYDPDGVWRTGSHGCTNVPFGAMELLFHWTPVGTPVQVLP